MLENALDMSGRNNPNYDAMVVEFAFVLFKTNQVDAAMEYLNREISESPRLARAWSVRAMIHLKRGELEPARADAQSALVWIPATLRPSRFCSNCRRVPRGLRTE